MAIDNHDVLAGWSISVQRSGDLLTGDVVDSDFGGPCFRQAIEERGEPIERVGVVLI